MPRLREVESVACCPVCGLSVGYRELCSDQRPDWAPTSCPRCGAALPSGRERPTQGGVDSMAVKRALRRRGMTLKSVAEQIGMSPSRLSHVLAGEGPISDEQLLGLARCVGVDPSRLW